MDRQVVWSPLLNPFSNLAFAAAFIFSLLIPTATFTMGFTSLTNFAEFKKRARVLIDYNIPFPMAVDLASFARQTRQKYGMRGE